MIDIGHVQGQKLLNRIAGILDRLTVGHSKPVLEIVDDNRGGQIFNQSTKALLTLAQGKLRSLAAGDIMADDLNSGHGSPGILNQAENGEGPAVPIDEEDLIFVFPGFLRLDGLFDPLSIFRPTKCSGFPPRRRAYSRLIKRMSPSGEKHPTSSPEFAIRLFSRVPLRDDFSGSLFFRRLFRSVRSASFPLSK